MRRTSIAVLGCALSLTVAACGGSAPAGTADSESSGGDGGPIKIGSLHPISGDLAVDGQQMDNGAKLAVEAINQAGGIKSIDGAKLQLMSGDTQGEPETGQSEAERLIQEGAVGLVGTYQSDVSANVSAVAERNEVPFVIDVSSDDAILKQGYKYTFRVQPSSGVMGTEGARYLSDTPPQRVSPRGRSRSCTSTDRSAPRSAAPSPRRRRSWACRSARSSPTTRSVSPT